MIRDKRQPDYCLKCKTNHTTTECPQIEWHEVDSDCWDGQ